MALLILAACNLQASPKDDSLIHKKLWLEWENGNFTEAELLSEQLLKQKKFVDDAIHVKINVLSANGRYKNAVELYSSVNNKYNRYHELSRTIAEAYLHLKMPEKALSIFNSIDSLKKFAVIAETFVNSPIKLKTDSSCVVPFDTNAQYSKFIPAIKGNINSINALLRFDTGGTFIVMGLDDAKKYNIEIKNEITGLHGFDKTKVWISIAKTLVLGENLELENVPVTIVESLKNFIIFGTNILEQFLTTIDYPNNRFIFTPRTNSKDISNHYNMLTGESISMPFYMINDHYMIAKGRFNNFTNLNWFIDSGLLALKPDSTGNLKQAGLNISKESLIKFGYPQEKFTENNIYFEDENVVSLGSLTQNNILVFYNNKLINDRIFGGIRTHGLLSHAFLSKYSWTIDFDKHIYMFNY